MAESVYREGNHLTLLPLGGIPVGVVQGAFRSSCELTVVFFRGGRPSLNACHGVRPFIAYFAPEGVLWVVEEGHASLAC